MAKKEDHPKDGRQQPLGMPTMRSNKDKAEMKHPHTLRETQGLRKFLIVILVVPVAAVLSIAALVLAPLVPASSEFQIYSAIYWIITYPGTLTGYRFTFVGIMVVLAEVLTVRLVIMYYRSHRPVESIRPETEAKATTGFRSRLARLKTKLTTREPGAKSETGPGSQTATTAQSTTSGPGSEGATPSAPPVMGTIKCKLCPYVTTSNRTGWFELLAHIRTHSYELDTLFDSLPPEDFAQTMIETYFMEAK
ncbi:MAG TPA: hypothetical protein VGS11_10775 [Candidatus Bathyarchaeia archaeon]|nr:hypothetical protein [Candidatus Bathyarchaeia archaeon]